MGRDRWRAPPRLLALTSRRDHVADEICVVVAKVPRRNFQTSVAANSRHNLRPTEIPIGNWRQFTPSTLDPASKHSFPASPAHQHWFDWTICEECGLAAHQTVLVAPAHHVISVRSSFVRCTTSLSFRTETSSIIRSAHSHHLLRINRLLLSAPSPPFVWA